MPGAGKAAPLVNTATASEQYYRDVLQKVLKDLGWRNQTEGPPPPDWRLIPWKDKLRCYDGTCFPVVSDAWGCCLTSCGCSWSDRVACCGMDFKGARHEPATKGGRPC